MAYVHECIEQEQRAPVEHCGTTVATQDKEGDDDASQLAILAMPNQTTRTVICEPH